MKQLLALIIFFLSACSNSNEVHDKIRGKWYFDSSEAYVKITQDEYTIMNDSPISEDYKLVGDSLIVKGFEASVFPWKYLDTLKIIKLTPDSLILKSSDSFLTLYK